MRSGDPSLPPSGAPGLSGPAHDSHEDLLLTADGASGDAQGEALTQAERATDLLTEGGLPVVSQPPLLLLAGGAEESEAPHDPVREVDRRNGNAARARKQALKEPGVVEDGEGNILLKAKSLVIPEEKRCQALTVHGRRCRSGKMRGMEVCVFHAHRALTDEALATLADPEVKPRLTPRKALQAVVALRAGELAEAAVGGALSADGISATRAVISLIDSVDPLVQSEETLTLSREGAETASYRQLRALFSPSG